jgi:hypothetical protein
MLSQGFFVNSPFAPTASVDPAAPKNCRGTGAGRLKNLTYGKIPDSDRPSPLNLGPRSPAGKRGQAPYSRIAKE